MRVLQMETENFTVCGCVKVMSVSFGQMQSVSTISYISTTIHIYPPDSLAGNHGSSWMLSMDGSTCRFSRLKKSRYE